MLLSRRGMDERVFRGATIYLVTPGRNIAGEMEKPLRLLQLSGADVLLKMTPGVTRARLTVQSPGLAAVVVASAGAGSDVEGGAAAAADIALYFQCPLVTRDWVTECIAQRRRVDTRQYLAHTARDDGAGVGV